MSTSVRRPSVARLSSTFYNHHPESPCRDPFSSKLLLGARRNLFSISSYRQFPLSSRRGKPEGGPGAKSPRQISNVTASGTHLSPAVGQRKIPHHRSPQKIIAKAKTVITHSSDRIRLSNKTSRSRSIVATFLLFIHLLDRMASKIVVPDTEPTAG